MDKNTSNNNNNNDNNNDGDNNKNLNNNNNDKKNPKNKNEYKISILSEEFQQYDQSYKIILLGDSSVGKTALTKKAVLNEFEEFYQATIGFEFLVFNVKINNIVIKLQIWDTCGQEIYRSLITNFYRNSSLAILVYSINKKETFINIKKWLEELKTNGSPDMKVFLVGNKIDLEREVSKEEAKKYAEINGIDMFMETSAKTGENAQKLLIEAAKFLYNDSLNYKKKIFDDKNNNKDKLKLNDNENENENNKEKKSKKTCCN
jgi:small GTP-binding protein